MAEMILQFLKSFFVSCLGILTGTFIFYVFDKLTKDDKNNKEGDSDDWSE